MIVCMLSCFIFFLEMKKPSGTDVRDGLNIVCDMFGHEIVIYRWVGFSVVMTWISQGRYSLPLPS